MSNKNRHKTITINALSNVIRQMYLVVATFLVTPIMIRSLGDSSYGLWVVILSVIGYAGMLEMGVQTAVTKMVAQYKGKNDYDNVNKIISASFLFFLGAGILSGVMCWFVIPHFMNVFVKNPADIDVANKLMLVLGIDIILVLTNYVFVGIIYGLQIYHIKTVIDIVIHISQTIAIYICMKMGYGIVSLAVIKTIVDSMSIICLALVSLKYLPTLSISYKLINKSTFKEMFGFGGKLFVSATLARVSSNAEPIMISFFLSTAWTAIYSVPKRLMDYLKQIVWALTTGFMPTFSELHSLDDKETIRSIYIRYSRYLLIITIPAIVYVYVYGEAFIKIWVGPDYALKGRYVILFLSMSLLVDSLQPLAGRYLIGVGKVNLLVKVSSLASIIFMIMSLVLTPRYGINGMAASAFVTSVLSQALFIKPITRDLEISITNYFRSNYVTIMILNLLNVAILVYLSTTNQIDSYLAIAVHVVTSSILYFCLIYIMELRPEEKAIIKNKLAVIKSKFCLQGNIE